MLWLTCCFCWIVDRVLKLHRTTTSAPRILHRWVTDSHTDHPSIQVGAKRYSSLMLFYNCNIETQLDQSLLLNHSYKCFTLDPLTEHGTDSIDIFDIACPLQAP